MRVIRIFTGLVPNSSTPKPTFSLVVDSPSFLLRLRLVVLATHAVDVSKHLLLRCCLRVLRDACGARRFNGTGRRKGGGYCLSRSLKGRFGQCRCTSKHRLCSASSSYGSSHMSLLTLEALLRLCQPMSAHACTRTNWKHSARICIAAQACFGEFRRLLHCALLKRTHQVVVM